MYNFKIDKTCLVSIFIYVNIIQMIIIIPSFHHCPLVISLYTSLVFAKPSSHKSGLAVFVQCSVPVCYTLRTNGKPSVCYKKYLSCDVRAFLQSLEMLEISTKT